MYRYLPTFAGLTMAFCTLYAYADELATDTYRHYVSPTGDISLPKNFRQHWTHLGSWAVTDANAPGHGFHDVYTQAAAVSAYQQTGKFPDGTILIKEIRTLNTATLTTGKAVWAGDNSVWFVMVKDTRQRFKGNHHWGDGWGWALFAAAQPTVNSSDGYINSCMACHTPAKTSDWVFVQGYPTLKP